MDATELSQVFHALRAEIAVRTCNLADADILVSTNRAASKACARRRSQPSSDTSGKFPTSQLPADLEELELHGVPLSPGRRSFGRSDGVDESIGGRPAWWRVTRSRR